MNPDADLLHFSRASSEDNFTKYFRLKWNSTTYTAKNYPRSLKTVNYVAIARCDNKLILVAIHYFAHLHRNDAVFIVGAILDRCVNWSVLQDYAYSQIMKIDGEGYVIRFLFLSVKFDCENLQIYWPMLRFFTRPCKHMRRLSFRHRNSSFY